MKLSNNKCKHFSFVKIDHWWYNFRCERCGKRVRWLPKGDYYTLDKEE